MPIEPVSSENHTADQIAIRDNKLMLVERLADDLAHEIKNPLHSMVINLEVLRRKIGNLEIASHDDLTRYTGILASEVDRVNRRVDLLLHMVRPNRDADDPATLAEIFDELAEILELECERKRIALLVDPPPLNVGARFPRASARQMILSLTLKTLDSLPRGGTVELLAELSTDRIDIRCSGSSPSGTLLADPAACEDDSYISVARGLALSLGGDLEVLTGVNNNLSGVPSPVCQYLLSLPVGS
jgi:signal transduction histidine kinase